MLFGDKGRFAIEIEVNDVYGDKFIGEGFFVVFVNNTCYGDRSDYATVFLCIMDELKKFYENLTNQNFCLSTISKYDIAHYYYSQIFTDNFIPPTEEKLKNIRYLVDWAPESAFDATGSFLIHIDKEVSTRIIGFNCGDVNGTFIVLKESVQEVIIPREEFRSILYSAYKYLQSFIKIK